MKKELRTEKKSVLEQITILSQPTAPLPLAIDKWKLIPHLKRTGYAFGLLLET